MIIGRGLLQRPSRASLLWSLAFVLAMVSTWVTLAGEALGNEPVRVYGLGLMLGAPALIWSGFRARRRVRAMPWTTVAQSLAGGAVLILSSGTRSEEHTSELQSRMRISYAVFCLKKK